jgi:mRNA-degrading endonuclease RelE of RelBE toxin-antitoxin system
MMKVLYGNRFWKQAALLPASEQLKLAYLLQLLAENPYDPSLHSKKLKPPLAGSISFRITRDWRVQFYFLDATTIMLTTVKHRKDIYR